MTEDSPDSRQSLLISFYYAWSASVGERSATALATLLSDITCNVSAAMDGRLEPDGIGQGDHPMGDAMQVLQSFLRELKCHNGVAHFVGLCLCLCVLCVTVLCVVCVCTIS